MRSNGPSHSTFGYCARGGWPQALGKVSLTIKKTLQTLCLEACQEFLLCYCFYCFVSAKNHSSILQDPHLRLHVRTFWELLHLLFGSWVTWQVVALQFECMEKGMDVLATGECVPSVSLEIFELYETRAGASHHLSLYIPNSEQSDNKWTLAV